MQLPQHLADGNTGEFWVNADGRLLNVFAGLPAVNIEKAARVLFNDKGAPYLIGNVEQKLSESATSVGSSADFEKALQALSAEKSLPAILLVRGDAPIFGSANPQKWERIDHVVTVYKLDSSGTWAYVVNPWGRPFDRWLPISMLYETTKISRPTS